MCYLAFVLIETHLHFFSAISRSVETFCGIFPLKILYHCHILDSMLKSSSWWEESVLTDFSPFEMSSFIPALC